MKFLARPKAQSGPSTILASDKLPRKRLNTHHTSVTAQPGTVICKTQVCVYHGHDSRCLFKVYRCQCFSQGTWSLPETNLPACQENNNTQFYSGLASFDFAHGSHGWGYSSITSLQQCARHDSRNFQATALIDILHLCGYSLALYNGQQPSADRWGESGEVGNILLVWVHNLQ